MSTASRVIKNTGYLYVKMGVTVFLSLLTTRLVLNSLGDSDFGLFNIVGGAIGMLGFLNSTMANATQRFMSYAEGEGNLEKKRKVFNISVVLHLCVALLTAVILFSLMYPLFNGILVIEPSRVPAAKIVFCSLVFSTMLTIINVPYDSVMNAHENMLYYSVIGILEALLKLGVALACVYTPSDKLVVYGVLMAAIPLVTLTVMKVYCHRKYEECVLAPARYWDGALVRRIASFSGWNFLTAVTSLVSAQGLGLVLNNFFGTVLNAAQGIAHQLSGQLSSFSLNMMKALNPVIVKNAGSGDRKSMVEATIAGCKFSTLLVVVFAVPFIIEMPYILRLWLKNVPDWAVLFCQLQLVNTVILQMAHGASTAVYAQGDIKEYAVYKSLMNILPIIVTYISFKLGGGPCWLYIPMLVFGAVGGDIVIVVYAGIKCGMSPALFLRRVLLPVVLICALMTAAGLVPVFCLGSGFLRLVLTGLATTAALAAGLYVFGLTSEEKCQAVSMLRNLTRNRG